MCTNPPSGEWPAWDGSFDYSLKALEERTLRLKNKQDKENGKEIKTVYLSGGEPTIHPQFIDFFGFLNEQFPTAKIKLLTNGRRFFYQDFSEKVLAKNDNAEIIFSICGPNAKIHDMVTRTPGSFVQMVKGLDNILKLRKKSHRIGIRFVVTKLTSKHIFKTLKFISASFPSLDEVAVVFMEIEGHGEKNLGALEVSYADQEIKGELEKSAKLIRKENNVFLYHFPLCTVPASFWPFVARTLPTEETSFLKKCEKCKVQKFCLGIPNYYLENRKKVAAEIHPPSLSDFELIESSNWHLPIEALVAKNKKFNKNTP